MGAAIGIEPAASRPRSAEVGHALSCQATGLNDISSEQLSDKGKTRVVHKAGLKLGRGEKSLGCRKRLPQTGYIRAVPFLGRAMEGRWRGRLGRRKRVAQGPIEAYEDELDLWIEIDEILRLTDRRM